MRPKAPRRNTTTLPLVGKSIYLIGSGGLQGDMMARVLEQETGVFCRCLEDMADLPCPGKSGAPEDILVLCDCLGKDLKGILHSLGAEGGGIATRALVALFNVTPDIGIEENAVGHGVKGVFYQSDRLAQFLKGILSMFRGELWLSRQVMTRFVLDRDIFSPKATQILTRRELEVLSMVAVGSRNQDIAETLHISANTVKTHIYNIFKKIEVSNRLQAALWAAKNL